MICHLVWMKYKVLIFFVSVSIRQAIDCRRSELVTYISCCCLLAYRSSHPEEFCKKGILRNFAKFTGKNLSQSLFFNKVAGLRFATLLKKDPCTGVFLWILRNFQEHLFYRTPLDYCFCTVALWSVITLKVWKMFPKRIFIRKLGFGIKSTFFQTSKQR